jgi:hypothetical protein
MKDAGHIGLGTMLNGPVFRLGMPNEEYVAARGIMMGLTVCIPSRSTGQVAKNTLG